MEADAHMETIMFLIDDLLLAPFKGMLWIFKEIHEAAEQELAGEGDAIKAELTELYMLLETGQISEAEFDASEKRLLDRLDAIEQSTDESIDGDENDGTASREDDR